MFLLTSQSCIWTCFLELARKRPGARWSEFGRGQDAPKKGVQELFYGKSSKASCANKCLTQISVTLRFDMSWYALLGVPEAELGARHVDEDEEDAGGLGGGRRA